MTFDEEKEFSIEEKRLEHQKNAGNSTFENCYIDESFHISENEEQCVCKFFPKTFNDNRGYFRTDWNGSGLFIPKKFKTLEWVKQMNTSSSKSHVFRGLHAQTGENCQGKLVTCKSGLICDVIIDCRTDSSTFLKAKSYILDGNVGNRLWVPKGFLHGFLSMEESVFEYLCDAKYDKEHETGVNVFSVVSDKRVDMHEASIFSTLFTLFKENNLLIMSEKDEKQQSIDSFLSSISENWYK